MVIEPDQSDQQLWRYGRPGSDGQLTVYGLLRYSPPGVQDFGDPPRGLELVRPTAMLLVGRHGGEGRRVVYDVSAFDGGPAPVQSPRANPRDRRAAGRARGNSPSLAERYGDRSVIEDQRRAGK